MAYKLKKEYEGLMMNFPELNMRNISTDELRDPSIIDKLMRNGHGGYFEPTEPVQTNVEVVIDEDLKKKQDKEKAEAEKKRLAEEKKLKEKAEAEIKKQLESSKPTASTSTAAKKGGSKSKGRPKKKK